MLENIYFAVEGVLGHNLTDAMFDCRALARKLDMQIHIEMNGTVYMVYPDATDAEIEDVIYAPSSYVRVG